MAIRVAFVLCTVGVVTWPFVCSPVVYTLACLWKAPASVVCLVRHGWHINIPTAGLAEVAL